jgi:hypothetical protein
MPVARLRDYASVILEMEASVKGDRVRKRRGGALRDEAAQDDDDSEPPDLGEGEDGYLPEEGQEFES